MRTLTGKEIELDIEADYKVRLRLTRRGFAPSIAPSPYTYTRIHMVRVKHAGRGTDG